MKNQLMVFSLFIIIQACSSSSFTYQEPAKTSDGLATATLETEGFNSEKIFELINLVRDGEFVGVHSVLISRNNKLLLEEYFAGYTMVSPHKLYSAGKSLASLIFGITVDEGLVSPELGLVEYFEPYYPVISNNDARKRRIKIKHLLTMSSGMNVGTFGDPKTDIAILMQKSFKPMKAFLDLEMISEPGTEHHYNDALPIMVANIQSQIIKESLTKYQNEQFYEPLGIDASNLLGALRPRDFLKVGLLVMNKGLWNGKRIVSEEWIEESTSSHIKPHSSDWFANGYGYYWWLNDFDYKGQKVKCIMAVGNGHQALYIIPELELIVVFTGGNMNQSVSWAQPHKMLQEYIIDALK